MCGVPRRQKERALQEQLRQKQSISGKYYSTCAAMKCWFERETENLWTSALEVRI